MECTATASHSARRRAAKDGLIFLILAPKKKGQAERSPLPSVAPRCQCRHRHAADRHGARPRGCPPRRAGRALPTAGGAPAGSVEAAPPSRSRRFTAAGVHAGSIERHLHGDAGPTPRAARAAAAACQAPPPRRGGRYCTGNARNYCRCGGRGHGRPLPLAPAGCAVGCGCTGGARLDLVPPPPPVWPRCPTCVAARPPLRRRFGRGLCGRARWGGGAAGRPAARPLRSHRTGAARWRCGSLLSLCQPPSTAA